MVVPASECSLRRRALADGTLALSVPGPELDMGAAPRGWALDPLGRALARPARKATKAGSPSPSTSKRDEKDG